MEKQNAIYLVTLEEVMQDAPLHLMQSRLEHHDDDILISWEIEVDVKTRGVEQYRVCVALTWSNDRVEPLHAMAEQLCSGSQNLIFASLNVTDYGTKEFAILIKQNSYGEVLVNSLVQEVIEKAAIEEAVTSWAAE